MILYDGNITLPRAGEVIDGLKTYVEADTNVIAEYFIPVAPVIYAYEPPIEDLPSAFILLRHKEFIGGQRVPTSGRLVTTVQVMPHVRADYQNARRWVDEAKQKLHERINGHSMSLTYGDMLLGFNWERTSGVMYRQEWDMYFAITDYLCVQVPRPIAA